MVKGSSVHQQSDGSRPDQIIRRAALWASLSLELLGKAALAKVSPLLIAELTEDGANVLIAVGLIEGTAKFTSVRASTVFKRCGKAFRPFNADAAITIATARNEYLHGAGIGFAPLDPDKWWPTSGRWQPFCSMLKTAISISSWAPIESASLRNTSNRTPRTWTTRSSR